MALFEKQRKAEEKETGRIEAFSDGVFAVAITLLVLNIHLPSQRFTKDIDVQTFLISQWLPLLAFLISFVSIGIMWINHHRLFTHIKRADNTLLILNLLLLLIIVFIPFPTALLAQSPISPNLHLPSLIYAGAFFLMSVFFNFVWRYASYRGRLLSPDVDMRAVRAISNQYLVGPPLYIIQGLLVFISIPASLALGGLLALFFALPGRSLQED